MLLIASCQPVVTFALLKIAAEAQSRWLDTGIPLCSSGIYSRIRKLRLAWPGVFDRRHATRYVVVF